MLRRSPSGEAQRALLRGADRMVDRQPHAMARIHVEGTLPHAGIHDASEEALHDLPAMRDLALAARLTGEARYEVAAARLMAAWLDTYRPSFDPIDETGFDALFVAWDLLLDSSRAPLMARMERLAWEFLDGGLTHPLQGATAINNWNSHRVKLMTLAAFLAGDTARLEQVRAEFVQQLRQNIRPDGSTVDFERRDAIHYVVYDLEPLAMAAFAARQHGEDWWMAADAALPRAFAWLEPYAAGRLAHEEFVHTQVAFDRERRDAGVKGFDGLFDPKAARTAFALAARLDPRWAHLARDLRYSGWLDVVFPLG
jgi:hypothetical protein